MRLTPGYLIAVATFYDMLETQPGRAPPRLRLHEHLLLAVRRRRAARAPAGGDRRRPRLQRPRLRVPRRLRHRADGVGRRRLRRADRRSTTSRRSSTRSATALPPLPDKQLRRRKSTDPNATSAEGECSRHEPDILFKDIDEPGLNTLDVYERRGGYDAAAPGADAMTPAEVIDELMASGLRGRGGAGFPSGKKVSFIPKADVDKYLVCNADESEPGTFKDRELMQKSPHMLIEGMIIAAYAAGANRSFIYIRGEYVEQADILDAAIAEADGGRLPRREHPRLGLRPVARPAPRRRRLHLRRGDRPAGLAGGQARQPAPEAAVPGQPGPLPGPDAHQQRRDAGDDAAHPPDGRRGVREDRHGDARRARSSCPSPATSSARATTRSSSARRRARSSTTSPAARPRAAR